MNPFAKLKSVLMGMCVVALLMPQAALVSTAAADDYYVYYYDYYAAIAYSQSTGEYGYSYGYTSLAAAEAVALANCDAPDSFIVTWACNGYCALALGDDTGAYGYGWGDSPAEAEMHALGGCYGRTENVYVAVSVFSGW